MPLDSTGKFRHNNEVAQMHSKAAGKPMEGPKEEGGDHVEIHSHGDGTFHTVHKGEEVQHETHGHALMHAAKVHGGEHFHAHSDGMAMHSHSMKDGGEPEHMEHDPDNLEALKDHFNQFIGEEQKEPEHSESEEGMGELYGG